MKPGFIQYQSCIEACLRAASTCNNCAGSITYGLENQTLASCVRACMETAVLCYCTAQLMSLGSKKSRDLARLCAQMCETCATECSKHTTDYCTECAEACMLCAEECRKLETAATMA